MTTNQPDRLDRIETTIENLTNVVAGLANAAVASDARMDRFEALVETSYEPVQALLEASTRHEATIANQEAMISRLDAILERMIYREGRNEEGNL